MVQFVGRTDRYRARPRRRVEPPCIWDATAAARASRVVEQLAPSDAAAESPPIVMIRSVTTDGLLRVESTGATRGEVTRLLVDVPGTRPLFFPQIGRGVEHLTAQSDGRVPVRTIDRLRRRERVIVGRGSAQPAAFAAMLIELAGAGVPIEFENEAEPPPELIGLHTFDAIHAPTGRTLIERELRSVRLRRAALCDHGPLRFAREMCAPNGPDPGRPVSVALSTRRPNDLSHALLQLERQVGCSIQLVLGLHGEAWAGFDVDRLCPAVDDFVVERFDGSFNLGDVLTALTSLASADLVTKWDDDDWYGRHHLLDLGLAYEYSGADIVGKAAEFVYLEDSDQTVRRSALGAETYTWNLAGGTILTSKAWILDRGGWPSVPRHVDRLFLDASREHGGTAYRTHGFEYVLRRRGGGSDHTWSAPDSYFADAASSVRDGLDLAFADAGPT